MGVNEDLNKLCTKQETYREALRLHGLAGPMTGAGSGFDLTNLRTHLARFCAFIASENLQNDDISRTMAQKASCLSMADFNKGVETVRKALGDASSSPSRRGRSGAADIYGKLMQDWEIKPNSPDITTWMKNVEGKLVMMGVFNTQRKAVKLAVFYWVLSNMELNGLMDVETLIEEEDLDAKVFKETLRTLDQQGQTQAGQIKKAFRLQDSHTPRRPTTPRSPTKTPRRIPPMKQSPTKASTTPAKELSPPPSPSKPSTRQTTTMNDKRKAGTESTDEEDSYSSVLDSPSKKRKVDVRPPPHSPSKQAAVVVPYTPSRRGKPTFGVSTLDSLMAETPTKTRSQAHTLPSSSNIAQVLFTTPKKAAAAPGRATQESPIRRKRTVVEKEISEDEEEDAFTRPRRFRPVFMDMKQWNARDPRIKDLLEGGAKTRKLLVKKYGDPFKNMK